VVQLGVRTSSDDLEGDLLERRSPPVLDNGALEEALAGFRGEILQRPPAVSAVHVGGERAYARARRGELVELPPRPVTIHSLQLLGWDPTEARDLGEHLGCGAALARLRRTETLGFDLSTAVNLERLASGPLPPLLNPLLALSHLERRQLQADELPSWRCGRALPLRAVARSIAEAPGTPACTSPGAVEGLGLPSCATPTEAIREASAAGPAGSDTSEAPAYAILNPDGSLAGIARLDPAGLLRPRLVFDAAG
jgi:tRNA pseudouridine55 synthase